MSYVYCGWLDSALKWILNNIISPVFNCIKSVLSSVFSFIYSNVLGPILDNTVYAIGRWLWGKILDNFFSALYSLAKMALQILDCLSDLFDTLLGVQPVIFKGEETTLLRAFLSMDAVRRAFWYINFFALGLAIIFAVYGVTRSMLDFDFENKRPVSRVMSSLLSSVLNLFTVQFAVFGIIYLAEAILTGLNSAMALAGGAVGNTTLGRMIFVLGTLNAANDESFNLSSDAVQSGAKIVGPTDEIRSRFFESSGLSPYKLSDVKTYFNIYKLDYIILIGLGLVFSFLLLIALIAVVRRLFNLLLLYIVSPLFAATIPLDDGEHFGKWRNLFVGTCFTGYGMLVAMKLYLLICPTIMGSELTMSASVELNFVCKVVFLLGGLWAVYKSSSMITSLISAEAGNAEGEAMAKGEEVGDLVKGGLWALVKAGDRGKKKEGQDGQDGQNGKLGEGSQRFNGKNTGAAGTGDHGKDNAFLGDMRNRNDKLEGAGKKDNKDKNSSLFQGKSKPGKTGKLGARNQTLDKFRKQFDMDNVDDLDKENQAEAGPGKNKNAFQERKGGKTTDSLGLGAKKLDAMRSKFRLDAGANAANAGDGQTELEGENTLDTKNKPGTNNVKTKAGGQNNKLEGQNDKTTSGVAAAAGRRDDSGIVAQHPKLELDDQKSGGAFGGTSKGQDDTKLSPRNRPNIDAMSAAKDAVNIANKPADTTAPVQGGNKPADVPVEGNKNNAFNVKNPGETFKQGGVSTGPAVNEPIQDLKQNLDQNPAKEQQLNQSTGGNKFGENPQGATGKTSPYAATSEARGMYSANTGEGGKSAFEMDTASKPLGGDADTLKAEAVEAAASQGGAYQADSLKVTSGAAEGQISGKNKNFGATINDKNIDVNTDVVGGDKINGVPNPQASIFSSEQKMQTGGASAAAAPNVHGQNLNQQSFQEPDAVVEQKFDAVSGQPNMQPNKRNNQEQKSGVSVGGSDYQGSATGSQSYTDVKQTSNYQTNETLNPKNQTLGQGGEMPAGGTFHANDVPGVGGHSPASNAIDAGQPYVQNSNKSVNPSNLNPVGAGMGSQSPTSEVPNLNTQTFGPSESNPQKFGQADSVGAAGSNGIDTSDPVHQSSVAGGSDQSYVGAKSTSNTNDMLGGNDYSTASNVIGGQKVSAGTQTQESGMSYARDDSDYTSSKASAYRSEVLNGSTRASNGPTIMNNEMPNVQGFNGNAAENSIHQTVGGHNTQTTQTTQTKTTQTNQTSTVHNDVNRVQMENQSTIDTQTSRSQTIFTGSNSVKMESQGTQTYESPQGFIGGNDTVNMRSNNFASNGNVGYNNIHQSVNENVETGGGSYARDDTGFNYGNSGLNAYRNSSGFDSINNPSTGSQYTYTQPVQTGVQQNAGFEKSESQVEREVSEVSLDTKEVHERAQKEKKDKNDGNKGQGKK